jgi:hypothetical protein
MFITLESEETVFILITFPPLVRSRTQSAQTDKQERFKYRKPNPLHFTLEENTLISFSSTDILHGFNQMEAKYTAASRLLSRVKLSMYKICSKKDRNERAAPKPVHGTH